MFVVEDEEEGKGGAGRAGVWPQDVRTAPRRISQWGHGTDAEEGLYTTMSSHTYIWLF